jgi:mannose-6-phosphate isomerase-like protein (cupin superfamily)
MQSGNEIVVVHAAEGRRISDARVVKAGLEHGAGGLTLMEMHLAPGDGSPPHIHHDADEAWYVLEGELTFYSGAWSAVVGAGGFVLVPRGAVHNYRVTSAIPARYLEMFAPAGKERFFEELSALYAAYGGEPVPSEERQALWRRHAMTLLVP